MQLYREYLACEGFELIEIPEVGFATFKIVVPECYIRDIYVRQEYRKSHVGSKIADAVVKVAKSRGCTLLAGTVVKAYKDADISRKSLLGYGFKYSREQEGSELYLKYI